MHLLHPFLGMAEAQTFGSAVLRLISLDEEWRVPVAKAGVVRYILPLLDAKLGPARWNSRQVIYFYKEATLYTAGILTTHNYVFP